MKSRHKNWVQLALVIIALGPAFFTQTIVSVFAKERWENMANAFYREILGFNSLNPAFDRDRPGRKNGKIAIITIGPTSFEKLGKPIKNEYYIKFFKKLMSAKSPLILTMLNFPSSGSKSDKALARAIASYERVVGSAISLQNDRMISNVEDKEIFDLRKILVKARGAGQVFMPVTVDEPDEIFMAKAYSGLKPQIDLDHPYCFHPFYRDDNNGYILPSSLLWASALHNNSDFIADNHFKWHLEGYNHSPYHKKMRVGSTICLSEPQLSCAEYMQKHDIFTLEFSDVIQDELKGVSGDRISLEKFLAGRVLILAESSPLMEDPFLDDHSGIMVHHYDIYARYLDAMIKENFLIKVALDSRRNFAVLPLILGTMVALASVILTFRQIIALLTLIVISLVLFSFHHLSTSHNYIVPIQALTSSAITLALAILFWCIFVTLERRGFNRLLKNLQARFSQANSLTELKHSVETTLKFDFSKVEFEFFGFDHKLHEAAGDPKIAVDYLLLLGQYTNDVEKAVISRLRRFREDKMMPQGILVRKKQNGLLGHTHLKARIPLAMDFEPLGYCEIKLTYFERDYSWVLALLDQLRGDLSLSVNRVQGLAIRTLADQAFIQKSWQYYFLGQLIPWRQFVSLPNHVSFNGNFERVMTPQVSKLAILLVRFEISDEAKLAANYTDVYKVFKKYYENAFLMARQYGVMKFFGDSLYCFVDESHMQDQSASDFLLQVACLLVKEAEEINSKKSDDEKIFVSCFLHVTGSIVGNLFSELMMDYSVMGKGVTKLWPLWEEARSNGELKQLIENHVIISEEAEENLKVLSHLKPQKRSISSISAIFCLPKEQAIQLAERLDKSSSIP